MIAFLKLIRYKNLFMVLLTMVLTKYALIDSIVKPKYLTNYQFIILALSVLFISAGGYILNDIFDVETDKVNKPKKLFIDNTISKKNAWKSYFTLTFIGFILGFILSINRNSSFGIFIFAFSILGLYLYSYILKKRVLIGNLLVSILCGLTIVLVYSFQTNYTTRGVSSGILVYYLIISYSIFAFLTTFIREIIKDIEDVDGDLKIKAKTLPIVFGRKRAARVAFFCSCILVVFLIIILQYVKNKLLFLSYGVILILLPLLYFMYLLIKAEKKKDFSKLSNLMKVIMLFGILSMLLFTVL
ncbi:hypothetical protein FDT66_04745 [Polaribacter aestuariivivens]|uniref:Prenyltransferase n=2 Tax=Polaribacter aestuariivivens TaxID=2304626 RepID=A0A5S3N8I9_9FLAO|nr:hypothetical protein FDT66_04745 [Polaribacter aestuariivivens]